jgi:hypothetical protein
LRLPRIREIAVILADVRNDQQFNEVGGRAGGEQQVRRLDRRDTRIRARTRIRPTDFVTARVRTGQ